jgi:hypothetical protein
MNNTSNKSEDSSIFDEMGSFMSVVLGNTVSEQNVKDNIEKENNVKENNGSNYQESSTTNSYTKCINSLSDKFNKKLIDLALKVTEKHDQNSFEEVHEIGKILSTEFGEQTQTNTKYLVVKGTYQYVFFAHLKTIEMWTMIK